MWQNVSKHCHMAKCFGTLPCGKVSLNTAMWQGLKGCVEATYTGSRGVRCREILNSYHYFSANLILKLKLKSWNRWFTLSDDSPCLFVCFLQTHGQTRENTKIPVFSKFFGCTALVHHRRSFWPLACQAVVKLWHNLSHNVTIFVTSAYHIASDETKWRLTFVMGGKKAILVWMHVEAQFGRLCGLLKQMCGLNSGLIRGGPPLCSWHFQS